MKTVSFGLILFGLINIFSKNTGSEFSTPGRNRIELKLTVMENSKEGKIATYYVLAKGKLSVYNKPFKTQEFREHIFTNHKVAFNILSGEIVKLRLDTLNNLYSNNCVGSATATDYFIEFKNGKRTNKIQLHHYYKEEIQKLVNLMNGYLPSYTQIHYLPVSTKQDCN